MAAPVNYFDVFSAGGPDSTGETSLGTIGGEPPGWGRVFTLPSTGWRKMISAMFFFGIGNPPGGGGGSTSAYQDRLYTMQLLDSTGNNILYQQRLTIGSQNTWAFAQQTINGGDTENFMDLTVNHIPNPLLMPPGAKIRVVSMGGVQANDNISFNMVSQDA